MSATRSQLRAPKWIDHSIDFGGPVVTFTFDANKITDAWLDEWARNEKDSDAPQINAMLADLIERWDILETEGGPVVPVSAEEIGKLFSLPAKIQMVKEFAAQPSDAEGNASSTISSTPSTGSTAEPGALPNGQSMSPTPERSASLSSTQPT